MELAALLEEYMGEEGSGDSSGESEMDDSIVSSDEDADFDLRRNDFDEAMVRANGAVYIVVDTGEEELTKATDFRYVPSIINVKAQASMFEDFEMRPSPRSLEGFILRDVG